MNRLSHYKPITRSPVTVDDARGRADIALDAAASRIAAVATVRPTADRPVRAYAGWLDKGKPVSRELFTVSRSSDDEGDWLSFTPAPGIKATRVILRPIPGLPGGSGEPGLPGVPGGPGGPGVPGGVEIDADVELVEGAAL